MTMKLSDEDINRNSNDQEKKYNLQVQTIMNALSDRIAASAHPGSNLDIDLDDVCDQLADELNSCNDSEIFDSDLTGQEIWNLQHNELRRLQIYQILTELTHRELNPSSDINSELKQDILDYMELVDH